MNGLVLEGGGVKGSYQVGAYFAFRDCHVKLDGFVGTSIGAFNSAILACGKGKELLDFWYNVKPGEILGFDKKYIEAVEEKKIDLSSIGGLAKTFGKVVTNLGFDNTGLYECLKNIFNEQELRKSKKDFGLVTVRLPKLEPIYTYKEMIPDGKVGEYILASCYLPVFREKKIIDNHYYIDGGFYDNSPSVMLADLGYKNIYVIKIKGIGIDRKHKFKNTNLINISPSRNNGKILELDQNVIRDNIMMGYYDTLRILKKNDGYKYNFKRKSDYFYNFICRKVDKRELRRIKNFFNAESNKEAIIKSFEYVMEKEKINYYDVYNPYKILKILKRKKKAHFVYKFLRKLKVFF